jgi:hypothetical protein
MADSIRAWRQRLGRQVGQRGSDPFREALTVNSCITRYSEKTLARPRPYQSHQCAWRLKEALYGTSRIRWTCR